ncbi:HAD family phosphatase [Porphyromonas sp.]|uniref:HAD family hydrolase n=1 Tax=Porphyromonas sp. TaxID=1924944 RepID=UPI0026DC5D72|nr:HAD family phosphatase [Porphyromonas sp.]MDO4695256.1 HAD family phosphatase [Porphyromonas sp.]MDO4771055.1 HAD family phosphatase [Porphyromonas sp.]
MIKNLLFDLGGVFIRLTREKSVRHFEALGIHDAEDMLDPYCQSGLFLDLELGKYDAVTFAEKLSEVYQLDISEGDVSRALLDFVRDVHPYKFDFIANELPSDIRLFLISNTNDYVYRWANTSDFLPNGRKLNSYFEKVYASCRLGMCKPDIQLFQYIIADAGIDPTETLFIDDGPNNVNIAKSMGFLTYCPENGEDWTPVLRKMLLEQ